MNSKTSTLARKATLGAAATGAVFGLQHQADAAIVYSGTQNITATPGPNIGINLDQAGNASDMFLRVTYASWGGRAQLINYSSGPFQIASGPVIPYEVRMLANGNISGGAGLNWRNGGGLIKESFPGFSIVGGQWLDGVPAFAAFRKDAGGGSFNYGWVRLRWNDTDSDGAPNLLTAIDWAYNTTVNQAITAGDIGAAPEPSRALLALAGLGATALRRRRKVA